MKQSLANTNGTRRHPHRHERAQTRTLILLAIVFLAGVAVSALWFHRAGTGRATKVSSEPTPPPVAGLSDSTRAVLRQLKSPVEVRFYALLDSATVPASFAPFAGRVEQMLALYEQEANGKIKVTRHTSPANAEANAALADGIKPFNADKGDACFLGVAVLGNGQKESLASLTPEWEQSLEADLTRAILRTAEGPQQAAAALPKNDPAVVEGVKRVVPNVGAVSLEEGTKKLRETSLKEFKEAAQQMDAKIKEAQQDFLKAQSSQSAADEEAARKRLQQLQAEQVEKLKEIAEKSKAQMDAFQQLKAAAQ